MEEPSYFFRLSDWQDRLLAYYDAHPDFIAPKSRRNEVMSFVKGGLERSFGLAHQLRLGRAGAGRSKHVMYVWLDALTNYLTAVGYPDTKAADYKTFWPADLHMVGKDIVRFHCVYWPAFLMAAGLDVPKRVFAHGWWTVEGQKMSKSLGNFVAPQQLVEQYGVDAVRYFMLRELPFGSDGDFSRRAVVGRINGDLANDFGNLAQRVLSMVQSYCGGKLPEPGAFKAADEDLLASARGFAGEGADGNGRARLPPRARNHLAGGRRRQPLCRRAGALGAAQDRHGASRDGALHAGGNHPPPRHPGAALRAGSGGETFGPTFDSAGPTRFRRA